MRGHAAELDKIAGRLFSGKITPEKWYEEAAAQILAGHVDSWRLGRMLSGDLRGPNDDDVLLGERLFSGQNDFLLGFYDRIEAGDYTDEEGNWREDLLRQHQRAYVSSMRATANEAFVEASEDSEEFDWVPGPAEHCESCLAFARRGPYSKLTIPAYPGDGSTECVFNCHCRLRRRSDGLEGFARVDLSGPRLSGPSGGGGGRKLRKVPTTDFPVGLPAPAAGLEYYEVYDGTSFDDIRETITGFDREVVLIGDENERVLYAGVVLERDGGTVTPLLPVMRDRRVLHNHPDNGAHTPDDLATISEGDPLALDAAGSNGVTFRLERPAGGWPSLSDLMGAASRAHAQFVKALARTNSDEKAREAYNEVLKRELAKIGLVLVVFDNGKNG